MTLTMMESDEMNTNHSRPLPSDKETVQCRSELNYMFLSPPT